MKTFQQRYQWAMQSCRKAGMRITPIREAILSFLAQHYLPANLEMVAEAEGVIGRCDSTTVFRTLTMFKQAEFVRTVHTPAKSRYFVLNIPGDNLNFLICRECGCVTELPLSSPMKAKIERIALARGFSATSQNCEVHGLCTNCQSTRKTQVPPSKLISGAGSKSRANRRAAS